MKGLTPAEAHLLRLVGALTPWRRDRLSRIVARYLDGDAAALDGAPSLKARLDGAIDQVRSEALQSARTRLYRVLELERYGPIRSQMLYLTARSFREADLPGLAERCERAAEVMTDADLLQMQSELEGDLLLF